MFKSTLHLLHPKTINNSNELKARKNQEKKEKEKMLRISNNALYFTLIFFPSILSTAIAMQNEAMPYPTLNSYGPPSSVSNDDFDLLAYVPTQCQSSCAIASSFLVLYSNIIAIN